MLKVEDVKKDLGLDAELFDFEEKDGVVAAKLKKFYKPNEFAKIAQRVKENANGFYLKLNKATNEGGYFKFQDGVYFKDNVATK